MASGRPQDDFSSEKAELFEALGHPLRIRLLQELADHPQSFADLKRGLGMESSGHLSFHLHKLVGLVKDQPDGTYALTDEGREAVRIAGEWKALSERKAPRSWLTLPRAKVVIACLLIALVALGTVVLIQPAAPAPPGGVKATIDGKPYWSVTLPLSTLTNGSTVVFAGVTFRLTFLNSLTTGSYVSVGNATVSVTSSGGNGTSGVTQGRPVTILLVDAGNLTARVEVVTSGGSQSATLLTGLPGHPQGQAGVQVFSVVSPASAVSPGSLWRSSGTDPPTALLVNGASSTITFYVQLG